MEAVTRTARTVEEAEELALKELGVDRSAVEVEVLSRGKSGFLGIGAELARVRVTLRSPGGTRPRRASPAPTSAPAAAVAGTPEEQKPTPQPVSVTAATTAEASDPASLAVQSLSRILAAAGVNVDSTVRAANDPEVGGPIIDISGEDSGLLIGRRGQTLQSLQFIVNLVVRKQFGEDVRVVLDVEHYRQRREESLRDMAIKVADRVAQTGRSITLEPMSAADRRIIHISLADHPAVITESTGLGEDRKVSILLKRS